MNLIFKKAKFFSCKRIAFFYALLPLKKCKAEVSILCMFEYY